MCLHVRLDKYIPWTHGIGQSKCLAESKIQVEFTHPYGSHISGLFPTHPILKILMSSNATSVLLYWIWKFQYVLTSKWFPFFFGFPFSKLYQCPIMLSICTLQYDMMKLLPINVCLYFFFFLKYSWFMNSLVAQLVKNLPAIQETLVPFLGREDLLEEMEKEMATHSSILA